MSVRAEKEIKNMLEDCGWFSTRASGSRGPADIISINENAEFLIQVKETSKDSIYAGKDVKWLNKTIRDLNLKAKGFLAVKFSKIKKWIWCDVKKMVSSDVTKVSSEENEYCKELKKCPKYSEEDER